jgi:predicted ATPase
MADKESGPLAEVAPGAASERQKPAAARQRRLQLQVGLANALLQSRGQHSSETKSAFDKARELASGIDDPLQRFSTYYGLWVGGYVRGERATMIEAAEALIRESDAWPDSAEAGIANRIYGVTCWMARGDLTTARKYLEKAVALYRPERDRELAHRFAQDVGVAARAYLSLVLWVLGESDRARVVMSAAMSLAAETKHAPTFVYANYHAAFLETIRLDPVRAKYPAETCLALAREHRVEVWTLLAPPMVAWANADWEEMGRGLTDCRERDVWLAAGTGCPLLAAGQSAAGQIESALVTADQAIAEAEQRGLCFFLAEAHHIRGEILLKRDPANTTPAEDAFLTAITIAREQKARSFELRAALSLAKLYQSTNRTVDAHDVLTSALEGFPPTPEFPEIELSQALLAALAPTDDMKNAAAFRRRRVNLQLAYGNALIAARGHGAAETTAAFARARELAAGIADPLEQMSVYYGQWVGSFIRCEIPLAREVSAAALQIAERYPGTAAAAVAYRLHGLLYWFEGDFATARQFLERSLSLYDPARDRDLAYRFGQDIGVPFMNYLAFAVWPLGEITRAQQLQADAVSLARRTEHVPTLAYEATYRALFEMMRLDAATAAPFAAETVQLAQTHDLRMYIGYGEALNGWVRAVLLGEVPEGIAEMQRGIELLREIGINLLTPLIHVRLASLEAAAGDPQGALARVDKVLADSARNENRTFDGEVHRIRGEILLKLEASSTAAAEQAFLTAIAIAQQQKARSFELRAALSLAKLYRSTGPVADAHAVLAPALEAFPRRRSFPKSLRRRRCSPHSQPKRSDEAAASEVGT